MTLCKCRQAHFSFAEYTINIDLHTHSTASDGRLTPAELVNAAADGGVQYLALTDHDTTAGLEQAQITAKQRQIQLIPGVEISVTWQRRTLHIVGLAIDTQASALKAGLVQLQATRIERAQSIAGKLEKIGVENAYIQAEQAANGGQITRTHFARLLIEAGKCETMQQCFKRYLKPGKPAYASAQWAELEQAIAWIHAAGGVAVLAHPLAYGMTAAWRTRTLQAFSQAGGDALEVHCGNSNPQGIRLSAADALAYGLLGSVGSDFHGPEQRWLKLGRPLTLPAAVTPVWSHPRIGLMN